MKKFRITSLFVLILSVKGFTQSINNELNMKQAQSISQLHKSEIPVSAQVLFKGIEGVTRALQINKGGLLKEHVTETEAMLICVSGEVKYEDEKKNSYILKQGEYIKIKPKVKHWVTGIENSQLLLIK